MGGGGSRFGRSATRKAGGTCPPVRVLPLDWFRRRDDRADDLDLLQVTDDADEAVSMVLARYGEREAVKN